MKGFEIWKSNIWREEEEAVKPTPRNMAEKCKVQVFWNMSLYLNLKHAFAVMFPSDLRGISVKTVPDKHKTVTLRKKWNSKRSVLYDQCFELAVS